MAGNAGRQFIGARTMDTFDCRVTPLIVMHEWLVGLTKEMQY